VKGAVFLDTGIFVAALARRDTHHFEAVELFGRPRTKWTTSVLVVSECYSLVLHRHGEEAARRFRAFLSDLAGLKLLAASLEDHKRTLHMLDRFRGAGLTYVDAASLAFIEALGIDTVWSTDHHLGLTGAEILPRS
jgi:predicted nucleic acid-binding protein